MLLWPPLTGTQLSPVTPPSWVLPSGHTPGNRHDRRAKPDEGLRCCVCLHTRHQITEKLEDLHAPDDNATVETRWCQLRNDWFDDNDADISNLLAEKNRLHKAYMDLRTDAIKETFFGCLRLVQQRLRDMQDAWMIRKAEEIQGAGLLPENQCGFRQHRGTTDMIFVARQLQDKCHEMRFHLYTTFVDLTKAFDTVNRDGLWKAKQKFGCPERFTHMVRQLHDGMTAFVTDNGMVSEAFAVTNRGKQGCVLAPTLFSLMFSTMLMDAYRDEQPEIRIAYRTDGHLLNSRPADVNVNGAQLKSVNNFTYLGRTLSRSTEIDDEVANPIAKARQAFGRL
ncbi:unnamed protein product [Schistocephalus solidus]|uniref:Reverse transcriptase domain-containing protein n=1 Tax=Schistocephalus solidus TaxID=70667 RepID=A0A183SHJ4_SCHSO|nr:unnamed protein product [Schistocephalus solidus]